LRASRRNWPPIGCPLQPEIKLTRETSLIHKDAAQLLVLQLTYQHRERHSLAYDRAWSPSYDTVMAFAIRVFDPIREVSPGVA
jgi:hypothetical protein